MSLQRMGVCSGLTSKQLQWMQECMAEFNVWGLVHQATAAEVTHVYVAHNFPPTSDTIRQSGSTHVQVL